MDIPSALYTAARHTFSALETLLQETANPDSDILAARNELLAALLANQHATPEQTAA
jgi:hypothetical protein